MHTRLGVLIVTSVIVFSLTSAFAMALAEPSIEFIPSRISANASFIMKVDPKVLAEPVSIRWVSGVGYGSVPKVGDMWYCYFSDSDKDASCGPSPFEEVNYNAGPYVMDLGTYTKGDSGNLSYDVYTGDITMQITTELNGEALHIIATPASGAFPTSINFDVYFSNLTKYTQIQQRLERETGVNHFTGGITLPPGEYFLAFEATRSGEGSYGGEIVKVVVPGLVTECSGGSGVYENKNLRVDAVSINSIVEYGDDYRQTNFRISNILGKAIEGLSVRVPSAYSSMFIIELSRTSLEDNESSFFSISFNDVSGSLDIATYADILSNGSVVGRIPVNVKISVIGGPAVSTGSIVIEPSVWSEDGLAGNSLRKDFVIENRGTESLEVTGYTLGSTIKSCIKDVQLPASIDIGKSGLVRVDAYSASEGKCSGSISLETSSGESVIIVNVGFFDLAGDLDELEMLYQRFEGDYVTGAGYIISDAADIIDNTDLEDLGGKDLNMLKQEILSAKAQLSALYDVEEYIQKGASTPVTGGGFDPTIIIIIIVVVVGGIGAWFYLTKMKGSKDDEGMNEFSEEPGDDVGEEEF